MANPETVTPLTQRGALKKDDNGVAVGWLYKNVAAAATTAVKAGPGVLHTLTINTPIAAGTITIYDSLAGSGVKIATITLPNPLIFQGPIPAIFDVAFTVGLTIVSVEAIDFTVSYI